MIRRPPRSTLSSSSAASDVYKRQVGHGGVVTHPQAVVDPAAQVLGEVAVEVAADRGPGAVGVDGDDSGHGLLLRGLTLCRSGCWCWGSHPATATARTITTRSGWKVGRSSPMCVSRSPASTGEPGESGDPSPD